MSVLCSCVGLCACVLVVVFGCLRSARACGVVVLLCGFALLVFVVMCLVCFRIVLCP